MERETTVTASEADDNKRSSISRVQLIQRCRVYTAHVYTHAHTHILYIIQHFYVDNNILLSMYIRVNFRTVEGKIYYSCVIIIILRASQQRKRSPL